LREKDLEKTDLAIFKKTPFSSKGSVYTAAVSQVFQQPQVRKTVKLRLHPNPQRIKKKNPQKNAKISS
jgi:hypothetical protein